MNRLYCVEHQYTVTGGMADHRMPLKASEHLALLIEVAKRVSALTNDRFSLEKGYFFNMYFDSSLQ